MADKAKSNDAPKHQVNTVDIESENLKDFQIPSFVNITNIWWFGQDIYMDMALLTVEQMLSMASETETDLAVYDRYVMSIATFDNLVQRMNGLREQLKSAGLIVDAQNRS